VQGYNGQAVVTSGQAIVAAEVTPQENDVRQLTPMLQQTQATLAAVGLRARVGVVLADAGYWSEDPVTHADPDRPELLIATTKDWKQRQARQAAPAPRGRIPKHLGGRDRRERKLLTQRGRRLYRQRSQTVEPVFGQIKAPRGCDRFMQRSVAAVSAEWKLICATHNLLKLYRSGRRIPDPPRARASRAN